MTPADPLSYDEIHAVHRRERSTRSLAKVPGDFYPRLSAYLEEARKELSEESSKGASPRVLLLQGQFRNLEETAREIVMLRLRKVAEMSFTVVEGGSLNERVLTPEELRFAGALSQLIGSAHAEALTGVGGTAPAPAPPRDAETARKAAPEPRAAPASGRTDHEEPGRPEEPAPPPAAPALAMLRILDDIPPFEGENKHVYRLRKEDIVSLPRDIASILVRRKKAVEMESPA